MPDPRIALTAVALLALLVASPTAQPHFSDWSPPVTLGPVINSAFNEQGPCPSKNRLRLYFISNRPDALGGSDIWVSQRSTVEEP